MPPQTKKSRRRKRTNKGADEDSPPCYLSLLKVCDTAHSPVGEVLQGLCVEHELLLINVFAKGMDKFPGVKDMGEHIRTSMNKVLEVALLVGAVVAAETMAAAVGLSGIGALFVIGILLLNRMSKKPIVELAIGPVATIAFGILLNLLIIIKLVALIPVG